MAKQKALRSDGRGVIISSPLIGRDTIAACTSFRVLKIMDLLAMVVVVACCVLAACLRRNAEVHLALRLRRNTAYAICGTVKKKIALHCSTIVFESLRRNIFALHPLADGVVSQ
jgi:hypothetical protein